MMGSLFAMSVAALLVVGAQFWYIIIIIIINIIITLHDGVDERKEAHRRVGLGCSSIRKCFLLISYGGSYGEMSSVDFRLRQLV